MPQGTIDELFMLFRGPRFGLTNMLSPNIVPQEIPGQSGNPQPVGFIQTGSVNWPAFADGVQPSLIVSTLPALPDTRWPVGSSAFQTSDSKLYVNVADVWVAAATAALPVGTVGIVSVSPLPTLPDAVYPEGSVVFLTDDGKLYRNVDGSTWSPAVDGGDITSGTITADAILAGTITAAQIATGSLTANLLSSTMVLASLIETAVSGARIELDTAGFRAYSSTGDLLVNIPTNGSSVYVNADIEALTMTVTGKAVFQSATNELAANAGLVLDSFQSNPTQAPTLAQSLNGVTLPADTSESPIASYARAGLDYDSAGGSGGATKVFYTVSNGPTKTLFEIKASDRTVNRSVALDVQTDTYGGVARLGSYVYVAVLHPVSNGAGIFQYYAYVERYLQSTLAFDARYGPLTGLNSSVKVIHLDSVNIGDGFFLGYYNNSHVFQGYTPTTASGNVFQVGGSGLSAMTAANIQSHLRTLTGDSGLTVTGTTDTGPFTVTFTTLQAEWSFIFKTVSFTGNPVNVHMSTTSLGGWGDHVPAIASDGTNLFLIAQNDLASSPTVKWNKYDGSLVKSGSTIDTTLAPGTSALIVDAFAGNADLGAARIGILFGSNAGAYAGTVQTFTTAGAIQTNEPWPIRSTAAVSGGITYGDAAGDGARFWSYTNLDFQGQGANALAKHSTWIWTTASPIYWVAYSWYDANATGGNHETQAGPRSSITMNRRWQMVATGQGIPGGSGNDYANNIRFYMKPNATDPGLTALKLQSTGSSATVTLTTYASGGAADPGSNGFSALGAAATISSQQAGWTLSGDGTVTLPHGYSAQGTSFPGSPATNDHFYRTDLQMEFYYDGTRWLSTALFTNDLAAGNWNSGLSATTAGILLHPTPTGMTGSTDIWLVDHISQIFINGGTALSGSNKWVGALNKRIAANTDQLVDTTTINSGASSTWRTFTSSLNALLSATALGFIWAVTWTKTGTPGNLFCVDWITYRIVAT